MTSIELVPATPGLIARFYETPPKKSTKTLVAKDGEDILWIAGTYTDSHHQVMFADFNDRVNENRKRYAREFILCMRKLLMTANRNLPIDAVADPEVDGSDRLLIHFGFEHFSGNIYRWHG